MNKPQEITVKTYKYDGRPHRTWKADLVDKKDFLLVLLGVFDQEITHSDLGVIRPGTISHEYYWQDRWYNVFRFHEPDGSFRNFYCNINMPPEIKDSSLEYVDLDIDILVKPDFQIEILDLAEFEQNKLRYNYPKDVVKQAFTALDELKIMIERRIFPFSLK